jgi:hypothetical protein
MYDIIIYKDIFIFLLYMSKNSGHIGVMNRKYCWDQLVVILKNSSINKILDKKNKINMDDKVSILRQILNDYVGSLKQKMDVNTIKNTKSYKLLEDLCLVNHKKINNNSFSVRWDNLLSHASKKSFNCRNQ